MKYLLDTNACITCLRRKPSPVVGRLRAQSPNDVALCSVVRAELLFGAERSRDPINERAVVERFLEPFISLPFDDQAASQYARIRHALERGGQRIGAHDLEIAAVALARGLTVVTHNVSEFARIPGLLWEDWESSGP
ncbi:MAG: type II toxin-antitoxin system VapC family toxin [Pseudomonadota bacterium]